MKKYHHYDRILSNINKLQIPLQVLENKSILDLTENNLKNVQDLKIDFVKNMDTLSRGICPDLKYFVSFSSVEFLYADKGYALNSYLNGLIQNIMRKRKDAGLCAVSISYLFGFSMIN